MVMLVTHNIWFIYWKQINGLLELLFLNFVSLVISEMWEPSYVIWVKTLYITSIALFFFPFSSGDRLIHTNPVVVFCISWECFEYILDYESPDSELFGGKGSFYEDITSDISIPHLVKLLLLIMIIYGEALVFLHVKFKCINNLHDQWVKSSPISYAFA